MFKSFTDELGGANSDGGASTLGTGPVLDRTAGSVAMSEQPTTELGFGGEMQEAYTC